MHIARDTAQFGIEPIAPSFNHQALQKTLHLRVAERGPSRNLTRYGASNSARTALGAQVRKVTSRSRGSATSAEQGHERGLLRSGEIALVQNQCVQIQRHSLRPLQMRSQVSPSLAVRLARVEEKPMYSY